MVDPTTADPVCDLDDAEVLGADTYLETYVDHPEGVAVARDGTVYASGEDGQVYRVLPETNEVTKIADTGGSTLCVTLDAEETELNVCDFQEHALFRIPIDEDGNATGEPEPVISGTKTERPIQPNYCVYDTDGRLYLTDSGDRTAPMDRSGGCLMAIEPDGEVRTLTEELSAWTNGLALTQDESTLYVAETGTQKISAVHLDDDGGIEDIEFVTDEFGDVDGVALDAADNLYVASIGDDAIYRLRDGESEVVLYDPGGHEKMGNPTNVAFGGPDMHTLYVANLGLPHLTTVELDRPGRLPTARL